MKAHILDDIKGDALLQGDRKKILMANVPLDGHFGPLTGIAVYLRELGHDVRWYSPDTYEKKIRSLGIPVFPFRKAFNVGRSDLHELFPGRDKRKSKVHKLKFDIINVFILRGEEYYEDIREIQKSFPFDVMISDCSFSGIPFVTDKLKVPVISAGVFPLMETSRDLPPYGLGETPALTRLGKWKQSLQRKLADKLIFGEPNELMQRIMDRHGIDTGGANVFDLLIRKSAFFLQSGTPGFEYHRSDLGKNIRFIGPLLPFAKQEKGARWYHPKMAAYSKVVLVTQGTVEKDASKLLIPTLEAFKDSRYLVIVTTGYSQTKELRARYPQDNIIIEDFIPFSEIMPYASVYVTNGGYGGVMLGIRHKLPMVVAGVHEGKNEINARVGYFRLGINLKTETPTPQAIRESVVKVCNDDTYIRHIEKLSAEFDLYQPNELFMHYLRQLPAFNTVSHP